MVPSPSEVDRIDHEHHQGGAEPAKPEQIGLDVASKKAAGEEKGRVLGASAGAQNPARNSSSGDRAQ